MGIPASHDGKTPASRGGIPGGTIRALPPAHRGLCGKGNNGATAWWWRGSFTPLPSTSAACWCSGAPEDLKGDAAANYKMLAACGCPVWREIPGRRAWPPWWWMRCWNRHQRPAAGVMLEGIRQINDGFPLAKVVRWIFHRGCRRNSGQPAGECARADYT